jgi:uncharacterized protein
MTPDERQMLGGLFQRVNAAAATPRDAEAEAFITDAVHAAPHAPYVLAQTVLVQQQALEAAAHRIQELEAARQGAGQGQEQGSFLGNLGRTIFGGGAPSAPPRPDYDPQAYQRAPAPPPPRGYAPPPPPPQAYPPSQGYPQQPGPWGQPQPSGGGFLQNAASTAAGVAGGVALGNLLGGLFGGHSGGGLFGGGLGGAGLGGAGLSGNPTEVTEINNYYDGAKGGGVSDADFQGFDPGAPGVQDANFDQLDDSSFDGSDGSSFDDNGGGGFDDV